MANEEIIDYIKQETAKGTSKDDIRSNLKAVGWQDNDIDSLFSQVLAPPEAAVKPEEPKPEPAQPKKKSSKLIIIIPIVLILLIAGASAYYFLFYSPCPKFTPPDFQQWGPSLIAHSWQNGKGYDDVIDLNMEIDQSGVVSAGSKWKNYITSYDFDGYEIVNRPDSEYRCWKGEQAMEQDPSLNYCAILLQKKDSDEQKVMWVMLSISQKSPALATFASYPGFNPVNWTTAAAEYSDSYCLGSEISRSAAQSALVETKNDLFSPGMIIESHMMNPSKTVINITNGLGADMILENITVGSCGKDLENEMINDKATRTFTLTDCVNGAAGTQFSGNLTLNYIESGNPSIHQFSSYVTAMIIEEETKEEEETIPLVAPCPTCIGIAYNHGGPSSFAWNGSEYGIAWAHEDAGKGSTLYFLRFSQTGNRTGKEIVLGAYGAGSKRPSIAWTGAGYNIAFPVGSGLYFIMTDAEGNKLSEMKIKDVSTSATFADYISSASIAWAGNESGVAWSESNGRSYFTRLDDKGARIGSDIEIGMGSSSSAAVVWIGTEYGVGWIESSATEKRDYLVRIENGEKISTVKLLGDPIFCQFLALSWAESRYGLASSCLAGKDKTYDEIFFTRIHSTGGRAEMIELDQAKAQVSDSKMPSGHYTKDISISMAPDSYGAAWRDNRDGNDEIYFALIDSYTGSQVKKELRITDSLPESGFPSIVSADSGYGLVFTETEDNKQHIYFTRVS